MITALVWKELREIRGITLIGLAALALLVGGQTGSVYIPVPYLPRSAYAMAFVNGSFAFSFTLWTFPFAMALGFRQTVWESSQGTFLFLLHRPVARGAVFLLKLATGIVVLLACSVSAIVLVGMWYARPGNLSGPFEWSMTDTSLRLWVSLPVVYFGAFLSGLRPGRWLGTRLLPLVGMLFVALFLQAVPMWWPCGLILILGLAALLAANVAAAAADREYP